MNHSNSLQQAEASVFRDQFGRNKRKLRISVTDRCNFKCVYCMPEHPEWMKKHNLLFGFIICLVNIPIPN